MREAGAVDLDGLEHITCDVPFFLVHPTHVIIDEQTIMGDTQNKTLAETGVVGT